MNDSRLDVFIPAGAPATAIPRETHMLVFRILKNLKISGSAYLRITDDGNWTIEVDGVSSIQGKREPFKVPALLGLKKSSNGSPWEIMSISDTNSHNWDTSYQKEKSEFIDGIDPYPWYALGPVYDYVRAVELPES